MRLWLDTETYSETPIKCGTYKYAETCELLLLSYAVDDDEPSVVDFTAGEDLPKEIKNNWGSFEIWAHQSAFDRNVLRFQKPELQSPITNWRDTLVQAYSHALPGSLDVLCDILGIPQEHAKLKDGKALVNLFCKPRPKNMKLRRATRVTHPEQWERFKEYARMDISAMRAVHNRMPKINYPNNEAELRNWHLDQVINDRGFQVDIELVQGALRAVEVERELLKEQVAVLTEGEVESATQRDVMLEFLLKTYGIYLKDLTKSTVEKAVGDDLIPEAVKEILRIRVQATSTSTSKYKALANAVSSDNRCRGTIQFAGGKRTARAAGRTFQPQNLPSRGLLEDYETEFGIKALKDGCLNDFIPTLYPNVTRVLTSAVRGVLVAPAGSKLCIADLSNIEGRKTAWFANETWKLKAFSDFDKGIGHDLYNLAYSKAFQVPVESVNKQQRSIGKVCELMLGYSGGVGAFVTGALGYGFDIEELAVNVWDTLPPDTVREATNFYRWMQDKGNNTHGLSEKAFVACDVLKRLWRESNPNISAFWGVLENSVRQAIGMPGEVINAGSLLRIRRVKNWLFIRLPSGRCLCYPNPMVDEKGTISYMGDNQYTRRWERITTSGGKLLENVGQASARETLYTAMPRAEEQGYKIVLHVHDELVTETPDTEDFSAEKLSNIMVEDVGWNRGLPLAAAGFESYRYKK